MTNEDELRTLGFIPSPKVTPKPTQQVPGGNRGTEQAPTEEAPSNQIEETNDLAFFVNADSWLRNLFFILIALVLVGGITTCSSSNSEVSLPPIHVELFEALSSWLGELAFLLFLVLVFLLANILVGINITCKLTLLLKSKKEKPRK